MPGALDIRVERVVRSDPDELFGFLSDLENHWRLADWFVEVLELNGAGPKRPARGGRVRIRGPLGLRRTAVTTVTAVDAATRIAGSAAIGSRTLAHVTWTLAPRNGGTHVALVARVERASLINRLLLASGGAWWMRRRLARVLAGLDGRVAREGRR